VFNSPVVIFVKESENLSEIFGLLLSLEMDMVENVEFSPSDFVIIVQIIGLQKLFFNLFSVKIFQVIRVGSSINVSLASFDHAHN